MNPEVMHVVQVKLNPTTTCGHIGDNKTEQSEREVGRDAARNRQGQPLGKAKQPAAHLRGKTLRTTRTAFPT